MTTPITSEDVFKALSELGDTPKGVAARLLAEGCKGLQKNCDACPIWVYLSRRFKQSIEVQRRRAVVGLVYFDLPPAVAGFINRFDAGESPELEAQLNERGECGVQ